MTAGEALSSRDCPACHTAVPAAVFCGCCGADLDRPADKWSILLRPRVFAAAPSEPITMPRVTSSLFPWLPRPARQPFRVALVLLLLAMIALSALRANGPLHAVSAIGGPALFVLYMWQSDAFRDISHRALWISWLTGAVTGVAWWLMAGRVVAGTYGVSTAAGQALQNVLAGFALAVTIGGAVVMVLAPVVVRLLRVPVQEPVDGYVIGAFGALSHTVAANITWLFPQIVAGLLDTQSGWRMFADAITYGVIDPLTSVAVVGLVGLTLWFRPRERRYRKALIVCVVATSILYVVVWSIDALALPYAIEVATNLVLAALTLIVTRCGLQIVLLHERSGPVTEDPLLCVQCEAVVPDMPFCVSCGGSAQASSRSSRRLRRDHPPVPELT